MPAGMEHRWRVVNYLRADRDIAILKADISMRPSPLHSRVQAGVERAIGVLPVDVQLPYGLRV